MRRPTSYNEYQHYELTIHHLFIPPVYNFAAEGIIGVIALLVFNVTTLNEKVFSASANITANPFSLWGQILDQRLPGAQSTIVQRILLFILWAGVGALLYILVFRLLQIFVRTRDSIELGEQLIQADHRAGAWHYLESLHDFFLRTIILLIGIAAIATGVLLCFGIASQELSAGLDDTFPANIGAFAISLIGTLLAMRIIAVGVSLLSPRFRNWYNA